MKSKILSILAVVMVLAVVFSGCSSKKTPKNKEVYLLAAASLTDVMDELIEEFEAETGYDVIPSYASSGALQSQIEQGAPADVFFSASNKQMNALKDQDLIDNDTIIPFLENEVVLITEKGNPKGIESFDDLTGDKVGTIALGEIESVPVGQYSEEILNSLGMFEEVKEKAVYASDVRAVLTWVESGEADCGMVYSTDAKVSEKVDIITSAPEGTLEKPVIYPVARVAGGENEEGAKAFLEFLQRDSSKEKLVKYGFNVLV